MGGLETALQAAAGALLLFPVEQRRDPAFGRDFGPMRQQAVQMQRFGAGVQLRRAQSSGRAPSAGHRSRGNAAARARRAPAHARAARRRPAGPVGGLRGGARAPGARHLDAAHRAPAPSMMASLQLGCAVASSRRIRAAVMVPRLAPRSAARTSKVWLAGAAWARRSVARWWCASRFCSTSAWTWAGSSICSPLS